MHYFARSVHYLTSAFRYFERVFRYFERCVHFFALGARCLIHGSPPRTSHLPRFAVLRAERLLSARHTAQRGFLR